MISAINVKTLKVDFNKVISKEDQAKVNFEVKKGSVAIVVTAKWAEDGKSATLEKATKFASGNYTVKASGLEFSPNGDGGSVEIKDEEATEIVIKSESLDKKTNAPFIFEVRNQYKEAMKPRPDVSVAALNKTEAGRVVTYDASIDANVLDTSATAFGDEIQLTVFVKDKPSVKLVKTLKVTGQVIDKIEFGEGKLEEGQTVLYPGKKIIVPVKAFVGANPMKLTAPAHTNGTVTDDGLIPTWNADDLSVVAFDSAKQELTLTVAPTAKAGAKTFNYVMSNGEMASFNFTVAAAPAPVALEAKTYPSEQLGTGKSTKVAFKVMMSDGKEAKAAELNGYKVKVSKKSKGNDILSAPVHGGATIDDAAILNEQTITAAATGNGKTETITYQLLDTEGKDLGTPVIVDVAVVSAIDAITVKADKTEYVSGDEITLTIQARAGGSDVDYTMEFKNAEVAIDPDGTPIKYFRDVNFVGGVATVKIPATKVFDPGKPVEVTLNGIAPARSADIKVVAGEVAKFEVVEGGGGAGKIKVTAKDKNNNTVAAFVGQKMLTITAKDKDGAPVTLQNVNAENQIQVEFTAGIKDNIQLKAAAFDAGTVITVSGEGVSGEYKIN